MILRHFWREGFLKIFIFCLELKEMVVSLLTPSTLLTFAHVRAIISGMGSNFKTLKKPSLDNYIRITNYGLP